MESERGFHALQQWANARDRVISVDVPGECAAPVRVLSLPNTALLAEKLTLNRPDKTLTRKGLVRSVTGQAVFGEIAIVEALEEDGWEAVWIHNFGGLRMRRHMPPAPPVNLPPFARNVFDDIAGQNGGKVSGFFDVMAWNAGRVLFVEYKGPGDSLSVYQRRWIGDARRAGIHESQLLMVSQ